MYKKINNLIKSQHVCTLYFLIHVCDNTFVIVVSTMHSSYPFYIIFSTYWHMTRAVLN